MHYPPEKEIKILDIDLHAVGMRLESLGATKVYEGERLITHFDTRDRQYAKQGKRIKVTKEEGVKLTSTVGIGTPEQHESKEKVGKEIYLILELLGLQSIAEVSAQRISYEWKGSDFDLDSFPGIPPFLEIDIAKVDDVNTLLSKLGLSNKERFTGGTPEIFTRYQKDYFQEFRK